MSVTTPGLHHVTAIAGDPARNATFYVETLGLRFVKRTVNHDDTNTYHFYFGDREGTPGTNTTFFPWTDGGQGTFGAGQTQETAYLIHPESVTYWSDRLDAADIDVDRSERFDETVLRFDDPDGIGLELVASDVAADAEAKPWAESPVPPEHQLRGLHSVTLAVAEFGPTAAVLRDALGFELEEAAGGRQRHRTAGGGPGSIVDLVETDEGHGEMGVGTVHHVAFEAPDVEALEAVRETLATYDQRVSEVIDRKYFTSIYYREPGGVLFEIATPAPGFTVDEDADELGSRLTLPEWLENERPEIEAQLPEFDPETIEYGAN